MTSQLSHAISDEDVAAYRRDGVVCLRGAFSTDWVERLRTAVEDILEHPTKQRIEVKDDAGGRFTADSYSWMSQPILRAFAFESPAAAIAARLLDATTVSLLYDQVLVKEPGTETPTSWHQDGPSWPLSGEDALTIWLPLDPVTVETGGMLYARGRHLGKHYGSYVNVVKRDSAVGLDEERCPDFEQIDGGRLTVHWDVEPGDCIIHHMWMPHGAGPNRSSTTRRRAHTIRFVSERCTFKEGNYQLRPLYDPGIKDGDQLRGDHFPIVPFERNWP